MLGLGLRYLSWKLLKKVLNLPAHSGNFWYCIVMKTLSFENCQICKVIPTSVEELWYLYVFVYMICHTLSVILLLYMYFIVVLKGRSAYALFSKLLLLPLPLGHTLIDALNWSIMHLWNNSVPSEFDSRLGYRGGIVDALARTSWRFINSLACPGDFGRYILTQW